MDWLFLDPDPIAHAIRLMYRNGVAHHGAEMTEFTKSIKCCQAGGFCFSRLALEFF